MHRHAHTCTIVYTLIYTQAETQDQAHIYTLKDTHAPNFMLFDLPIKHLYTHKHKHIY